MHRIYVIRFCADALLPQFFQKPVSFVLSAVFEPYSVKVPTVLSSFRFLGQLQFFCSFKDFGQSSSVFAALSQEGRQLLPLYITYGGLSLRHAIVVTEHKRGVLGFLPVRSHQPNRFSHFIVVCCYDPAFARSHVLACVKTPARSVSKGARRLSRV